MKYFLPIATYLIALAALAVVAPPGYVGLPSTNTFAWDPSPSPDVQEYVLRWGATSVTNASSVFTNQSAGNALSAAVQFPPGTWFIHCVAVDNHGDESFPSNELVEFVPRPRPLPPEQLRRAQANQWQR